MTCLLVSGFSVHAQKTNGVYDNKSGYLSLGVRNTLGLFITEGKTYFGKSAGGNFGLRFGDTYHSRWFGDYITTNFNDLASRNDVHGGFSFMPEFAMNKSAENPVMFYPLAGFCIDYTKISVNPAKAVATGASSDERYSFATQFGLGFRIPLSARLDFAFDAHYMLHIGTDIDVHIHGNEVELIHHKGSNLEGHLLFAATLEYKMFKLWGR